jgi:spore coat polysaccharide biosynthesis predicted glycosyltransferase SpsG
VIAICIEASHARGLGHLFKAVQFAALLREKKEPFVVLVNDDPQAASVLDEHGIPWRSVPLWDASSDWESDVVRQYGVTIWLNDRLDTGLQHAERVKRHHVKLVTVDDRGTGAALADLHFAPLLFTDNGTLGGKRVLTGHKYLILSKEIDRYKRVRDRIGSIVVTLGGSDTYGVTLRVVKILKNLNHGATIVTGPSFGHMRELERMLDGRFSVKSAVPSLVREFSLHDLAITGGGVTPFEANASGLPCIVIASENHEIEIGIHLAKLGSSLFAGHHSDIDEAVFKPPFDISAMSRAGMDQITTMGAEHVYREIAGIV